METNPARTLLRIFERWSSLTDTSVQDARALNTHEGMEETTRALYALKGIKDFLDFSEASGVDIQVFRAASHSWFRIVFNFGNSWSYTQGAIDSDLLRALIPLIDSSRGAYTLNPATMSTIEATLSKSVQELLDTLKNADGIDAYLRSHLTAAVLHVSHCLEQVEHFGVFDLAAAIADLELLLAAAAKLDREDGTRWDRFREAFKGFTHNPTTVAIAGALGGSIPAAVIG